MTEAEVCLWSVIRMKQLNGCLFSRQKVIGDYIVDFFCSEARLVIEVDGGHHYFEEAVEKDQKRDHYLESQGLKVLRFTNVDAMENIEGVVERIPEVMAGSDRKNPRH